jgi:hypothetical protein
MGQSSTRPLDSPPGLGAGGGEGSEQRRSGGGSGFHNLHLSLGGGGGGGSSRDGASSAGPSSSSPARPVSPSLSTVPAADFALGHLPPSLAQPTLPAPSASDAETIEGHVVPQGVYPEAPHDYHRLVVRAQILKKRLAPFYKPLPGTEEPEGSEECPICFLVRRASSPCLLLLGPRLFRLGGRAGQASTQPDPCALHALARRRG